VADVFKRKGEESFIFCDVLQGSTVLVMLVGKKSVLHYIAEVMNDFDGNVYIIYYK
jgi:hypothetical protein